MPDVFGGSFGGSFGVALGVTGGTPRGTRMGVREVAVLDADGAGALLVAWLAVAVGAVLAFAVGAEGFDVSSSCVVLAGAGFGCVRVKNQAPPPTQRSTATISAMSGTLLRCSIGGE